MYSFLSRGQKNVFIVSSICGRFCSLMKMNAFFLEVLFSISFSFGDIVFSLQCNGSTPGERRRGIAEEGKRAFVWTTVNSRICCLSKNRGKKTLILKRQIHLYVFFEISVNYLHSQSSHCLVYTLQRTPHEFYPPPTLYQLFFLFATVMLSSKSDLGFRIFYKKIL